MIKQAFLIWFITITSLVAQSPIDSGVYRISGGISASFQKDDYHREAPFQEKDGTREFATYSINPGVSYFLLKGLNIGVSLRYHHSRIEDSGSEAATSELYGLGPSIQYFFLDKQLKPFVGVSFLWSIRNDQGSYFESERISMGPTFSIGGDYFLSRNVALRLSLNHSINKSREDRLYENFDTFNKYTTISANTFIQLGVSTSIF